MDRRSFIKKSSSFALASSCGASLLVGCQSSPNIKPTLLKTQENNKITVHKTVLENDDYSILQATTTKAPIFLHQQQNGKYVALLLSCTHQNCTVSVGLDNLVCPCHGAKFDKQGTVLRGPADKNLLALEVYEKGDEIIISLP